MPAQPQTPTNRITTQQAHQQISHILGQIAQAQGLPTYRDFHAQNGVAYTAPSDPGTLGVMQTLPSNSNPSWIPENQQQIQSNLQAAQMPQNLDDWQARMQAAQQQAYQDAQQNQVNLLAGFKWNPSRQSQQTISMPSNSKVQEKSRNAWQNLQAGAVLDDSELKQVLHDLDLRYYGATKEQDKRQAELLRLYAVQKQAENMVTQAERDQDGNILLNGVPVRPSDALYFAKLDVQHFEQTDTHLSPKNLLALTFNAQDEKQSNPKLMSPAEAYRLIHSGQIKTVLSAHISKYYTWNDFFITEIPQEAELSAMKKALLITQVLDKLSDQAGYKVKINSGHRTKAHQIRLYAKDHKKPPLGSRHIVGDGVDIKAENDKLYLYRIARSMPEIRRIGYPDNGAGFLHIDLLNNTRSMEQQIFVDNGTVQSDFRTAKILPVGNTAKYGH